MAAIRYTLDDMPSDKPNCGNCTYRGAGCARARKDLKDGVRNSCTGNIDGYVYRCVNYQGRKETWQTNKTCDLASTL